MKNIYYPSAQFHKAVKRNKPKVVYCGISFWFFTQKAVLVYSPQNNHFRNVMYSWLKSQNIEVHYVE